MILGPRPGETDDEWSARISAAATWESNIHSLGSFLDKYEENILGVPEIFEWYWKLSGQQKLISDDQFAEFDVLIRKFF